MGLLVDITRLLDSTLCTHSPKPSPSHPNAAPLSKYPTTGYYPSRTFNIGLALLHFKAIRYLPRVLAQHQPSLRVCCHSLFRELPAVADWHRPCSWGANLLPATACRNDPAWYTSKTGIGVGESWTSCVFFIFLTTTCVDLIPCPRRQPLCQRCQRLDRVNRFIFPYLPVFPNHWSRVRSVPGPVLKSLRQRTDHLAYLCCVALAVSVASCMEREGCRSTEGHKVHHPTFDSLLPVLIVTHRLARRRI